MSTENTRTGRMGAFAPATPQNPATLKLTWDNTHHTFKVYDKVLKVSKLIDLPFKCLVLDNYKCISGWCEKESNSYYSNEVKNLTNEPLIVKVGNTTVIAGKYNDIKDNLSLMKAKYSESLYVMLPNGTIANIILTGSNVKAWFDFRGEAKQDIVKKWIGFANPQMQKKGKIEWSTPEIKLLEDISNDDLARADVAYDTIHDYKNPPKDAEPEINMAETDVTALLENSRPNLGNDICDEPEYEDDGLPF